MHLGHQVLVEEWVYSGAQCAPSCISSHRGTRQLLLLISNLSMCLFPKGWLKFLRFPYSGCFKQPKLCAEHLISITILCLQPAVKRAPLTSRVYRGESKDQRGEATSPGSPQLGSGSPRLPWDTCAHPVEGS